LAGQAFRYFHDLAKTDAVNADGIKAWGGWIGIRLAVATAFAIREHGIDSPLGGGAMGKQVGHRQRFVLFVMDRLLSWLVVSLLATSLELSKPHALISIRGRAG